MKRYFNMNKTYLWKQIYQAISDYNTYGLLIFYAYFFPVYWKYDYQHENNGFDIISLGNPKGAYFYDTYDNVQKIW